VLEYIAANQDEQALRHQGGTDRPWRVHCDGHSNYFYSNRVDVLLGGRMRRRRDRNDIDRRKAQLLRGLIIHARRCCAGIHERKPRHRRRKSAAVLEHLPRYRLTDADGDLHDRPALEERESGRDRDLRAVCLRRLPAELDAKDGHRARRA
jgi:hypothetical protein